MRWLGAIVRPHSLVSAFVTTGILLGTSVVTTLTFVVAAARTLDRATSPLVDATQVRHEAMAAAVLESEARHRSASELPRNLADVAAAQGAVRAELVRIAAEAEGLDAERRIELDTLPPLWDLRCALAREVIALTVDMPEAARPSLLLQNRHQELRATTLRFNDLVQSAITHLDQSARRSITTLKVTAVATSVLALVLLLLSAAFAERRILRPLVELAAAEGRVAQGHLDVRVDTEGVAEVRELALGFNEMVASLRARAEEVREKQDLLGRRERALAERNKALAAANAELDAFAYAASHDLRAPLRGIENMARFLAEDVGGSLDAEARDKLERIRRAARRLHHLIDSLLEVARAGREIGSLETVSLADAAALALDSLEEQALDANARVTMSPDLPLVTGDRMRIVQVFQNLLSNAIKYASGPGRTPKIEIGAAVEDDGDTVAFWVQDNGIGIPENQHRRIFQLFRRLHRETEYEGAGVGLSIVQRAVQAHGGTISVESSPGAGARFTVRLPTHPGLARKEAA
jgi:signal transduction histidine kinase